MTYAPLLPLAERIHCTAHINTTQNRLLKCQHKHDTKKKAEFVKKELNARMKECRDMAVKMKMLRQEKRGKHLHRIQNYTSKIVVGTAHHHSLQQRFRIQVAAQYEACHLQVPLARPRRRRARRKKVFYFQV